jgi:acetyl-CoA carboxylase biotin carboxylase subunit
MAGRKIAKVLIANRGEIAVRVIRACREMGIATVAVYSDVDRLMPHVQMADEAYSIGAAPSRESYLAMEKIVGVARKSHADAIHPGYGFLAENEEFAGLVIESGFIFVGPRPESIKAMGDKTEARALVKKANVPVVPGTDCPISSESEAREFCAYAGFPVLVKAAAGGGGKGMRLVKNPDQLGPALSGAQSEALSAFGDGRVYLEKYLENPRHIEFQILADEHGNIIHCGERECSIQRRHQKVIEESPSVILDEELRQRMGETAMMAARACNYHNAGTIEFLVDKDRNFYFLEMNTRLQVEHPVTEMRTGIDIVAAQLRIAMGEKLPFKQEDVRFRGHAIECRICAEDISNNYLPSTGRVVHLRPAEGLGVRDDRGIETGGEISVYYDPMIAKLVTWGNNRAEACDRMKRALREYEILGVKTNIPLHLFVLGHKKFLEGDFDTHFLDSYFKPEALNILTENELIAAAIVAVHAHTTAKVRTTAALDGNTARSNGLPPPHMKTWRSQRIRHMR